MTQNGSYDSYGSWEKESLLGEQQYFFPPFTGCISESTDILSITNFDQKKFLEIIFSKSR